MADDLDAFVRQVAPLWRPQDPPGGFIATELKKIHDDSHSVFPESVYGGEGGSKRATRWRSTMHSDFVPIDRLRERAQRTKAKKVLKVKALQRSAELDDCGVSGTLGDRPSSMFKNWKVPSRLTGGYGDGKGSPVEELAALIDDMSMQGAPQSARELPALPVISNGSPRHTVARSHPALPRDKLHKSLPDGRQPKALATKALMARYQPRNDRSTAARWVAQASDQEKKVVENAFKITAKKDDVTKPVTDWLGDASPKERDVALTFFQSIAGTQLLGGTKDKEERVEQVIKLLKNPPHKYDTPSVPVQGRRGVGMPRRLLTPETRKRKFRHQTWHHLPAYDNTHVYNKSAILVEPHATVHRHFTIHPDWGP